MNNEKLLSALYRFSTTIQDENADLRKQYSRIVSVRQLNFKSEQTKYQLLCKRFSFQDPHITPLIRKTAYVFDILIVIINSDGRIIAVENEKELQEKWRRLKEKLKQDHAGYTFENYLNNIDTTLYDKNKLIEFLESDKMYGLLFKNLWLIDNMNRMSEFRKWEIEKTLKLTKESDDKLQHEYYIFQGNDLMECLKITNHIQYEILWLG